MKRLKCIVLVALILFVFTACSNKTFDNAKEKGLEALIEKNYSTAVSYFEIALEEKKDSPEVKGYLEQANLLNDANNSLNEKNYDEALRAILKIEKLNNPLSVVKAHASDLKEQISSKQQNHVYENELEKISSLIDEGNFDMAKNKLETLKNVLANDPDLTAQLDELTQLLEDTKTKQASQTKESQQIAEKDAHSKAKPAESEQNQKENFSYQTYTNTRFGFTVEYPTTFTVGPAPTNNDGRTFYNEEFEMVAYGSHINTFEQNETIETYYNRALGDASGPIAYKRLANDWYTISYTTGDNIVYEKAIINEGVIFTLNMTYPTSQKRKYDKMVTRVAKTFTAGGSD